MFCLQELRTEMSAMRDSFDATRARKTADEIGQVTGRLVFQASQTWSQVYQVLNAEQKAKLDEMIAQVDNGIFLDKWSSGMEDPQGWGIQVTCHYGHEIKGGKITDRVFAPIGISGYVPDVLGSVSAVSNQFKLDPGGCGKGHKEMVSVSSGGPHLLMKARLG